MSKKSLKVKNKYQGYTVEELKNIFVYDGINLFWKIRPSLSTPTYSPVSAAGLQFYYKGKSFHRQYVIFFMVHGYLPAYITFIDENYNNLRIENLRGSSSNQLKQSKQEGVCWQQFRCVWRAYITVRYKGRVRCLWSKTFSNEQDAIQAILNPLDYPYDLNGVCRVGTTNIWVTYFNTNNKREVIGNFKTKALALDAYQKYYKEYYGLSWEQEVKNRLVEIRAASPFWEAKNATLPLFDESIIAKHQAEKEKEVSTQAVNKWDCYWECYPTDVGIHEARMVMPSRSHDIDITNTPIELENNMSKINFKDYLIESITESAQYIAIQDNNASAYLYFIARLQKDLESLKQIFIADSKKDGK